MKKIILALVAMSFYTLTYSQNANRLVKYNSAGTATEASNWEVDSNGDIFPQSSGLRNIGNDTAGIRDIYIGNSSGIQILGSNAFTVTRENNGDNALQVHHTGEIGFYNVTRWKAQAGTVWGNITFGGDRFIMHAGTSKNLSLGAGLTSNYIILNTTGRTGFGTGISGSTINAIDAKVHIIAEGDDSTTISLLVEDSTGNPLLRFLDNGNLHVAGDVIANSTWLSSDKRLKTNVKNIPNAMDRLKNINGTSYRFKEIDGLKLDKGNQLGVIAQNVEQTFPELVRVTNFNGVSYKTVNYTGLIPVLIEAIKELNEEMEKLKNIDPSTSVTRNVAEKHVADPDIRATLFQNAPNPFNEQTNIRYTLPEQFSIAAIYVYDMQGNQISKHVLTRDQHQLTISANEMQPGMFLYSLIVDGKEIDTKRMILTD